MTTQITDFEFKRAKVKLAWLWLTQDHRREIIEHLHHEYSDRHPARQQSVRERYKLAIEGEGKVINLPTSLFQQMTNLPLPTICDSSKEELFKLIKKDLPSNCVLPKSG